MGFNCQGLRLGQRVGSQSGLSAVNKGLKLERVSACASPQKFRISLISSLTAYLSPCLSFLLLPPTTPSLHSPIPLPLIFPSYRFPLPLTLTALPYLYPLPLPLTSSPYLSPLPLPLTSTLPPPLILTHTSPLYLSPYLSSLHLTSSPQHSSQLFA